MGQTQAKINKIVELMRDGNLREREKAGSTLLQLLDEGDLESFVAAGGIPPLVTLMRIGNDEQKEEASRALWILAMNNKNIEKIAAAGEITTLVALLRSGNKVQKEKAAGALWILAINYENREKIAAAGGIAPLVALVRDGNGAQKENATAAIRILAINYENKEKIAAVGGIAPLVALVRHGSDVQKEAAAGALSNLAVSDANKDTIAAAGAIAPLVAMVKHGNGVQKENASAALSNLAMNYEHEEEIAAAGDIPLLVALAQDGSDLQKEKAARVLMNWAINDTNKERISAAGGIPPLVAMLRSGNDAQKENAAGALWILTYQNTEMGRKVLDEKGLVDSLIKLVRDGTPAQQEMAAGVSGVLSQHLDPEAKAVIITCGGIEILLSLVHKPDNGWKQEGLTALLELCADGDDTIRSVVEKAGGREILTKLVQSDDETNKKLAGQVLAWLGGNLHEISTLCEATSEAEPMCRHVLERLQSLLGRGIYDVATLKTRLRALLMSNGGKSRVIRLVGARSVADGLADLHREIDELDCQDSKGLWQSRWEIERAAMKQQLFDCDISSLVKDLNDTNAQTEALTLLSHEIRHNKNFYSKDERKFLYAVVSQVVGFSGLEVPPVEKWFIGRHEVQMDDVSFNCGSFGQIYHGTYMKAPVVVKCVKITSESNRSDFLREVNVWHDASRHPNIVQLYGACHVGTPCFMVCKYIAGGSLPEYLYRQGKAGRSCAWKALLGVTHGLQLLHSRGIIHGDLKGNNILVEGDTAMLTDFGMSFFGSECRPRFENLGAIRWRAPEFISTGNTSFEADVYSLGMCIVEAVTGRLPWGLVPDISVKWHLQHEKFLQQPDCMSDEEWALVCAMCEFDPTKRWKLCEVEQRIKTFADMEEEAMWEVNACAA
ncbi:hypothetical protein PRNP1_012682 [Phytophthora ramorum]